MSQYNLERMRKKIQTIQDKKRYEHTLGVMYTAASLAMRYEEDVEKALVAGLLHDCAKSFSTNLIHAKLGAEMALESFDIEDAYITDAIQYHTTGRPNMTLLDKIIYIADYIEPNRNQAPNLALLRKMAFEDLDQCMYQILEDTLAYLNEKGCEIDKMTEQAYLYYKQQIRE